MIWRLQSVYDRTYEYVQFGRKLFLNHRDTQKCLSALRILPARACFMARLTAKFPCTMETIRKSDLVGGHAEFRVARLCSSSSIPVMRVSRCRKYCANGNLKLLFLYRRVPDQPADTAPQKRLLILGDIL